MGMKFLSVGGFCTFQMWPYFKKVLVSLLLIFVHLVFR